MTAQRSTETYTAVDLAELTGATYRQIDVWCRMGYLSPAVKARGSGTQRLFDADALDTVGIVVALVRVGFPPPLAFHLAARKDM